MVVNGISEPSTEVIFFVEAGGTESMTKIGTVPEAET